MGRIRIEYEKPEKDGLDLNERFDDPADEPLIAYRDKFVFALLTYACKFPTSLEIIAFSRRLITLADDYSQKVSNGYKIVLDNVGYFEFQTIFEDAKSRLQPHMYEQFERVFSKLSHHFEFPNPNPIEDDTEVLEP